jgi:hypothetical protein
VLAAAQEADLVIDGAGAGSPAALEVQLPALRDHLRHSPALRGHDRPQQPQRVGPVALRQQLLDAQEEARLVARRDLRQAPDRGDLEVGHAGPVGQPDDRRIADDVADPRGRDVVGAADHGRQQRAVGGLEVAIGGLLQVRDHEHRLDHARARDLTVHPAPEQPVVGAYREGHRALPLRSPGRGAGHVRLPALG